MTKFCPPHPVRTFSQAATRPTELYDLMGLTPKATADQVKDTYFRLSKIYHPDICKDPQGVEKFVVISKAYETLGNEEKRREYDRGILNPIDDRSGHAASRVQHEITYEDLRRWQMSTNHEIKSKRSKFVQKGKRTGVYDFDEYYKQHYKEERESRQDQFSGPNPWPGLEKKWEYKEENEKYRADRKRSREEIPASSSGRFKLFQILALTLGGLAIMNSDKLLK